MSLSHQIKNNSFLKSLSSLSLPSLRFVIDIGFQQAVEYNYETRVEIPKEIKITEEH